MTVIDKSDATRRAMRRIVHVLRLQLPQSVTSANDLNNELPVPPSDAYHTLGVESDVENILKSKRSACFVYPTQTVSRDRRTGDGVERGRIDVTVFNIAILFRKPAGFNPIVIGGTALTATEVMWEYADRLRAGMIECLYKYAPNSVDIHALEVLSDLADVLTITAGELTGRANLQVEVTQNVKVPMATWTIP